MLVSVLRLKDEGIDVGLEEKNVVGSRKTKQRKVDEKMKKGTCEDKGGGSRDNVRERGGREMRE